MTPNKYKTLPWIPRCHESSCAALEEGRGEQGDEMLPVFACYALSVSLSASGTFLPRAWGLIYLQMLHGTLSTMKRGFESFYIVLFLLSVQHAGRATNSTPPRTLNRLSSHASRARASMTSLFARCLEAARHEAGSARGRLGTKTRRGDDGIDTRSVLVTTSKALVTRSDALVPSSARSNSKNKIMAARCRGCEMEEA